MTDRQTVETYPTPHNPVEQIASMPSIFDDGYSFEQAVEYFKTMESAEQAPRELSFDELINQEVERLLAEESATASPTSQKQAEIDQLEAVFASDPTPDPEPRARERSPRLPRLRRALGAAAIVAVTAPVAFFGVGAVDSARHAGNATEQASPGDQTDQDDVAQSSTPPTGAETTVPQAGPAVPVVAEANFVNEPVVEFTTEPNEQMGTMSLPTLCLEVETYAQHENDKVLDSASGDWVFRGEAPINYRNPDANPVDECLQADQYAAAQRAGHDPRYLQRSERNNKASNQGNASQWEPVAIHEMNDEGVLSVYPGQEGNATLAGHRTTYGAGFNDLGALQPGDPLIFDRADGKSFSYRAVGYEVIPAEELDRILNWSHPDSPATMTLYACSDGEGRPGSASHRLVWRFVMDTSGETTTES